MFLKSDFLIKGGKLELHSTWGRLDSFFLKKWILQKKVLLTSLNFYDNLIFVPHL